MEGHSRKGMLFYFMNLKIRCFVIPNIAKAVSNVIPAMPKIRINDN